MTNYGWAKIAEANGLDARNNAFVYVFRVTKCILSTFGFCTIGFATELNFLKIVLLINIVPKSESLTFSTITRTRL